MFIKEGDFLTGFMNGTLLSIPVWSIFFLVLVKFIH